MLKFVLIFSIFFCTNIFAEVVKKIEVVGNERINPETIKVYGEIEINKDYSDFDIDKILKNLFATNFFEDIKITLSNNILTISVKEYPTINSILIEGEKTNKIKEAILEMLNSKEKSSFIKSSLNEDINIIKKIYASMGFNFAVVEAKIEKFSENRLNLNFLVVKGDKTSISEINFIGDKKIKDKRLRDIIVSEEDKFWKFLSKSKNLNYSNIELDDRLLVNYYKSLGYYDVQVISSHAEISKDNVTTLTYNINAGTRYKVTKISTNVVDVVDKKIFAPLEKSFKKVVGKYYSPFTVKKLLDELDVLIANNDLQFIEHSVNEILDEGSIEIKINVFEGSKKLVEKINIKGNSVTNEAVIRGELLVDEGDPFNLLKLDQSIARLKSRNIFSSVKKEILDGSNNEQKIVDIKVEEKPTGEISAGAGIGTKGGSFAFNISENNWMGKGVRVSTNIELDAETFRGGLRVNNPNYNFTGNALNYHISSTSNDKSDSGYKNNLISTGIGTRFEQYQNIYISPGLTMTYDKLDVVSSASDSLKKQDGTFTDLTFDYGIQLDNRDRTFMPTNGYISSFAQAVPLYADKPFIKNTYVFSAYNALTPDVIGAFKFFTSAINGLNDEDVRISKRNQLGNSRLRGFESGKVGPKDGKDYIGGNYAFATNFEANLPNLLPESTKTDIGLFLDFGSVWGVDYDSSLDKSNKIRSSTGVNTSWISPVGPMSFIFSKNISKASTDVTESFNFRLGTTF